jgi:hypothetical protein
MTITYNPTITTVSDIQGQPCALAQLTEVTNELTRKTAVNISFILRFTT